MGMLACPPPGNGHHLEPNLNYLHLNFCRKVTSSLLQTPIPKTILAQAAMGML
jgi:hypothetical protein